MAVLRGNCDIMQKFNKFKYITEIVCYLQPRTLPIRMNSQGEGMGPTGMSIRVGPSRRAKPRRSAPRVLRAKRSGKAPAEIVLIAGRKKRARLVDRKREASREPDLRHFVDEDALFRELGTDRCEDRKLRRKLGEPLAPFCLPLID